jgi:hypothetical protein
VPVLNSKSNTFSQLVPVQRPPRNRMGICTVPDTLFLDLKKIQKIRKIFWKHSVPGTTFIKISFKTKLVPGTKYGVEFNLFFK